MLSFMMQEFINELTESDCMKLEREFYEPSLTFALAHKCAYGRRRGQRIAVSDPQRRGPAPINYSITAMALVIAARALLFDPTVRFNSTYYPNCAKSPVYVHYRPCTEMFHIRYLKSIFI